MQRLERLTEQGAAAESKPKPRSRKLGVLQASADRLEQLEAQLREAREARQSARAEAVRLQAQVRRLTGQQQPQPQQTTAAAWALHDALHLVTARHALCATTAAQSRLAMLTLDLSCDTIVEASWSVQAELGACCLSLPHTPS